MNIAEDILTNVIKDYLPEYETRQEQILMSSAVEKVITEKKHLLVEAGTGVGKSLAYLIPVILEVSSSNKKAIISTYTKTLQEQLIKKDLPLLQKIFTNISFAAFYGSENYLCLRRLKRSRDDLFTQRIELDEIEYWSKKTSTGLLLELPFEIDFSLWKEICRESDLCLGKKCAWYYKCYYRSAWLNLRKAQIIVVNHSLFFTNLSTGRGLLPRYNIVVFDEGHNIEEVASELLGIEISNFQIKYLLSEIYSPTHKRGLLRRLKGLPENWLDGVISQINTVLSCCGEFFSELLAKLPPEKNIHRVRLSGYFSDVLSRPLKELYKRLKAGLDFCKTEEERLELKARAERALNISNGIKIWIEHSLENQVYWVEQESTKRGQRIVLHTTMIDISEYLRREIFTKVQSVIITSATLSIENSFNYLKRRLGIDNSEELILGSPFDYKNRVVIYLPQKMPDPRLEEDEFHKKAEKEISKLVKITQGRAFVLFTSYRMLNFVYIVASVNSALEDKLTYFRQTDISRYQLLEKFRQTDRAVLLGTDTFWQGVDVPGDELICVIISRLPFDVPSHPVIEAKIEAIVEAGGDAFYEYTLPQAVLKFRQGFGRLIRRKTDWGIVAVIDPRIKTRWYGEIFLRSVPECPVTSDITKVKHFYDSFISKE